MKVLTKKIIITMLSFILAFTCSTSLFASNSNNNSYTNSSYHIVEELESKYGTIYYLNNENNSQMHTLWDVLDIAMAGYSWAQLFGDPSFANFGWAILDTVSLLPLLPSSAYIREGNKVFLKSDEMIDFISTTEGRIAFESAMQFEYYDNITDGLNFSDYAAKHMSETARHVPVYILTDVIETGVKMPDPRGTEGFMYYKVVEINNKKYNLEVLYYENSNIVTHFKYDRKAMGPLEKIPK